MFTARTALITGGSGSFGRAFIRAILAQEHPARVIAISRNAEMRYRLEQELPDPRLDVRPGDVRHAEDLRPAFDEGVDIVVHAAADKHIGTGQKYADYVRAINVGGAQIIIDLAREYGVAQVLALSTDKACNPVNVYGQSKAEAERLFIEANRARGPRFAVVRYGNVAGSSGSVIPLFVRQRQEGRLTVTDLRMTRFFMALSDGPDSPVRVYQEPGSRPTWSAVGFVLYALRTMQGGEIFVPRIPSGTIANLAQELGPGCMIEQIGVRDGEKLHEELIHASEASRAWDTGDGVFVLARSEHDVRGYSRGWNRLPEDFRYRSDTDPWPIRVTMPMERVAL